MRLMVIYDINGLKVGKTNNINEKFWLHMK